MSSEPTPSSWPQTGEAAERSRSGRWMEAGTGRTLRLVGLGVFAATIGAVAAYQVFAPSNNTARSPPLPPPAEGSAAPVVAAPAVDGRAAPAPEAPVLRYRPLSSAEAYLANAAIPDSHARDPAARPFALASATRTDRDLASTCLTQAVYYEAASESLEGQRAVAQVVLNRVRDGRYPKTVCGVVFQGSALRTGCQFSFTCDGSMRRRLAAAPWRRAHAVAEAALDGFVMTAIGHATHYHTVWVTPYWSPSLVKWGRIGAHIFYRWAGGPGTPAAAPVAYSGGEPTPEAIVEPSVVADVEAPAVTHVEKAAPAPIPALAPAPRPEPAPEPPRSAPAAAAALAPPPAPYQAVRRRPSLDSPSFAARD